jgi:hypothetical protein
MRANRPHQCQPAATFLRARFHCSNLLRAQELLSDRSNCADDLHSGLSSLFPCRRSTPPRSGPSGDPLLSATPNSVRRPTSLLPDPSPLHLNANSCRDLSSHNHPVKPGALPSSATLWPKRPKRAGPLPCPGGLCHCWRSPMQQCHFSFSNQISSFQFQIKFKLWKFIKT